MKSQTHARLRTSIPLTFFDGKVKVGGRARHLTKKLRKLEYFNAAAYIEYIASAQISFINTDDLFCMFDWEESYIGYDYWYKLYIDLVELGAIDRHESLAYVDGELYVIS
ncbi:MAG: hypothetical protein GY941_11965 [Planctomycetes bacterium]|nr:hypothetical protein [Planctomycetota bacterium]